MSLACIPRTTAQFVLRPGEEWTMATLCADHAITANAKLRLAKRLTVYTEETGAFMYNSTGRNRHSMLHPARRPKNSGYATLYQSASSLGTSFIERYLSRRAHAQLVFRPLNELNVKQQTTTTTGGEPTRPAVTRSLAAAISCQSDKNRKQALISESDIFGSTKGDCS